MKKNSFCNEGFTAFASSIHYKAIKKARVLGIEHACRRRIWIKRYCVASLISLTLSPLSIAAPSGHQFQSKPHDIIEQRKLRFTIKLPAQSVADSLNLLAAQTGAQFLFPYQLARARPASAISGEFTIVEAVEYLLEGSGLVSGFEKGILVISDTGNYEGSSYQNDQGRNSMNSKKNLLASMIAFFVGVGGVQSVVAQEGGVARSQSMLEEVIVTATKRGDGTNVMDIPMSISAISGDEISSAGINNLTDLSYAVPNLSVWETGPGLQTITLRGVGNSRGSSSLVGLYLDEVPVSVLPDAQLDLQSTDLQRVEVLRGPQGTLYGQGSVGGTVRFISNAPSTDEFSGQLGVSVYDTHKGDWSEELSGILNVPLIEDKLAIRLSSTYKNRGGWIDQPATGKENINDNELKNHRLKALWMVTDDLTVDVMAIHHRNSGGGRNIVNLDPFSASEMQVALDNTASPIFSDEYDIYNVTVNYDLGFATLTSASSYLELDKANPNLSQYAIFAFAPSLVFDLLIRDLDKHAEVISQEIRLAGETDNLSWTVGTFFRDSEENLFNSGLEGFTPPSETLRESTSIAWFADFSYSLSEQLTLGLGTRYFEDEREVGGAGVPLEEDFNNLSSKLSLSYTINDDVNVYASAAEGFRSGGFNEAGAILLGGPPSYDEETLVTYEIGLKSSLLDRSMTAEFALFFSDYNDLQTFVFDPSTGSSSIINVAAAEIKGVEWNIQWAANESFVMSFNGNLTDSEVTEVDQLPATQIPGDPLDYVPEYSYAMSGDYKFRWPSSSIDGFVRVEYNRQGKNSVVNRTAGLAQEEFESESIGFLNAHLGAVWPSLELELYAKNLLDEDRATTASISRQTPQARPRTIGVQLKYDF